jgi:hypothetical protein
VADGIGIRVKADAALTRWAKNAVPSFKKVVVAAVEAISFEAGVRAQANAPIDTGDLRRSIRAGKPKEVGGGSSYEVEVAIEASEPYALKMHEELNPYGAGRYNLGPLSRDQPETPEGGVGGKYLARAIERNIKVWEAILGKTVAANLGRAAKPGSVIVRPTRPTQP